MPQKDPEARRAYQVAYMRRWYSDPANAAIQKRRVRANQAVRHIEIVRRITEIKSQPCTDCGGSFDPVCMDFDHLDGNDKVPGGIARLVANAYGWEAIMAEIAKCELVCANCHRLRTAARGYKNQRAVS